MKLVQEVGMAKRNRPSEGLVPHQLDKFFFKVLDKEVNFNPIRMRLVFRVASFNELYKAVFPQVNQLFVRVSRQVAHEKFVSPRVE